MKITRSHLRKLIKEELSSVLSEAERIDMRDDPHGLRGYAAQRQFLQTDKPDECEEDDTYEDEDGTSYICYDGEWEEEEEWVEDDPRTRTPEINKKKGVSLVLGDVWGMGVLYEQNIYL